MDARTASALIARNIRDFCEKYLPDGKQKGDWWVVRVPWRPDKTPSLGVSLTTGRFRDFGRPEEKGDALDLYCRVRRMSVADAIREVGG